MIWFVTIYSINDEFVETKFSKTICFYQCVEDAKQNVQNLQIVLLYDEKVKDLIIGSPCNKGGGIHFKHNLPNQMKVPEF